MIGACCLISREHPLYNSQPIDEVLIISQPVVAMETSLVTAVMSQGDIPVERETATAGDRYLTRLSSNNGRINMSSLTLTKASLHASTQWLWTVNDV